MLYLFIDNKEFYYFWYVIVKGNKVIGFEGWSVFDIFIYYFLYFGERI